MKIAEAIMATTEIVNLASKATLLAMKGIEAARIGDEAGADRFLEEARGQFSSALADWDAAVAARQAEDNTS